MISMLFILGFCWSYFYLTRFDLTSFFASFQSDRCVFVFTFLERYSEQSKIPLSTFRTNHNCAMKIMIDIYRWYGFCNVGADPLLHLSGLWHFWQWEVLEVQPPTIDHCLIMSSSHVFTNPESTKSENFPWNLSFVLICLKWIFI